MDRSKNLIEVDSGPDTSICYYCKQRFYYKETDERFIEKELLNYAMEHLEKDCPVNKSYWKLEINEA